MLKEKLKNRQLTIGTWITINSTSIAEILANAGYDWLVIDLEHSTISIDQTAELIRTIELSGVSSLVRLTNNDENQIKRIMDAGARGIVVPMIMNAEEAKDAIASTRYPPLGKRGVGLARAQGYGATFNDYFSWQSDINDGPVVIVQIEHIDAVENLKNILNVEGIDAFFIGPYDLSCSMGIPGKFDHPKFKHVLNKIIDIRNDVGAVSGLHVIEPDIKQLCDAVKAGHKFIAYSVDIRMMDVTARHGLEEAKKLFQ
jgi:2-keto-3-deoxy-L-rhamnonate aldolase RhmA